jgi:hypothetical protein
MAREIENIIREKLGVGPHAAVVGAKAAEDALDPDL